MMAGIWHCAAWLVLLLLAGRPTRFAEADIFTSIVQMEDVLNMEHLLAEGIEKLIQEEEQRLDTLKSHADDFRRHSREIQEDIDGYLSNPLNAFRLMKRFTVDWLPVNSLIRNEALTGKVNDLVDDMTSFPNDDDLKGAVKALMRLQDTYQLETADLAAGNILNISQTDPFSGDDCYDVGKLSCDHEDYYHCIMWLQEALSRFKAEGADNKIITDTMNWLAYAVYEQGNPKNAIGIVDEILAIDPKNSRASSNKRSFKRTLKQNEDSDTLKNERNKKGYHLTEEFALYERVCRGEHVTENPYKDQVYCRYKKDHPFNWLRPLKEEVLYIDPFIAVYHDIITDSEIEAVKSIAAPRLHRSIMLTHNKAKPKNNQKPKNTDDYRISKSAWLYDADHPLIEKVSKKVSFASGLSLVPSEELQVLNYGMGGQYEPHFDWTDNIHKAKKDGHFGRFGNRISTSLYYMSDVLAGGGTAFPWLGVHVAPEKGMMLFWWNLHANGTGDQRTKHAGCPVLVGSKWVCNKWIHEKYQEFNRPCSLDPEM